MKVSSAHSDFCLKIIQVHNLNALIGASLPVAINAVKKGAAAEGMTVWDYVWCGHDP